MCEQATISRTQVNNNVLDFDDLLKEVLNGSFNMSLPSTFKKLSMPTQLITPSKQVQGTTEKGMVDARRRERAKTEMATL